MAKPPCPFLPSEAVTRNRLVTPEKVECLRPAELNISQHIKMPSSVTSKELIEKSVQAAVSAIELYNKPDFKYREESFAILMSNAWELLLKAKTLKDSGENLDTITEKNKERRNRRYGDCA